MVTRAEHIGYFPVGRLVGRFSLLVSVTLAISACGSDGGGSSSNGGSSSSPAITPVLFSEAEQLVLEVQPIQVCDDDGIVCAQVEFFETVTDKIWGQAGIDVAFLPTNQLNDSTYLIADDDEFFDLSFTGDPGDFGRHPESTDTSGPINLWLVDQIEASEGLVQFGNAWVGFNGVLVSDDIFDFNDGVGRMDVIAHELGHNLGLRHSTFGAGTPENLMSSGAVRTVPESIDDIFPDGDGLSQLTPEQIDVARSSSFVTSLEPDEALPITEADAVPIELLAAASAAPSSQFLAATQPVTVPESTLPWAWLWLLPLGKAVYSRINR